MPSPLRAACGDVPFVFVVGKGGVGKTTTAAALAVDLADAGEDVHLISTDPADSTRDVFAGAERFQPDRPCGARLCVEAFDASAFADAWSARARPALEELIARGTWLDDAEAAAVLDVSLPGLDEVMAALRLVQLADEPSRKVVDTAPTGHTLRLLDAGSVIETWIGPLRAMAAKAAVVASSLARVPVRLTAERFLDEQDAAVQRYRRDVLGRAAFLVVERDEPAVRAETDRLLSFLAQRSLAVAAVVSVGRAAERAGVRTIELPAIGSLGSDPCADLLRLARSEATVPTHSPAGGAATSAKPTQPDAAWLLDPPRDMLLVAGKGGVGKSTCAAAIAVALASAAPPVCLVSTDPMGSLDDVLGMAVGARAVAVAPGLSAHQIEAAEAFEALRDRYRDDVRAVFRQVGLDEAAALDRAVVESLWDLAPPGIDEVVAMIELAGSADSGQRLVVDSAPTGHFLRLLEMPEIAIGWTRALMRLLLRHGVAGRLEEVSARVLDFSRRLRTLTAKLRDPTGSAAVIVTLDEPLVRAETERLRAALDAAGVAVAAVIANRAARVNLAAWEGVARGAPLLAAPGLVSPPSGVDALRRFFARWERLA